ncbi:MAG: sigma-70 family RNA polymerase sigma factor [bacterium]
MSAADKVYGELIGPIEDRMMRTVARIVQDPDDAADAFQNALAYIWKNLKKIHRHPNPHGYILRVCVSAAYDVLRHRARLSHREASIDMELHLAPDSPEHPTLARETVQRIRNGIASLPRKQAQAVLLRAFDNESFEFIGKALGCSESTARSHVSKGFARLRQILSGLDPSLAKEIAQ